MRSAMTEPNIPLPTTTYFVSIIRDSVFKKIIKIRNITAKYNIPLLFFKEEK